MSDQSAAITPIATATDLVAQTRSIHLPRLTAEQLAEAKKLALTLKPDAKSIYGAVELNKAEAARAALTAISRDLLDDVTLGDMKRAQMLSSDSLTIIRSLRVEDLSPEPRETTRKVLGFARTVRETVEDVVHRVENFFKQYQEINTILDNKVLVPVGKEIMAHTKTHQQLQLMHEQNWNLFHDLRISFAAVKIFLESGDGYQERERRNAAAKVEVEAAQAENREPDQVIIEAARAYQNYIERSEMYGTTLSAAIVDAYQKSVAISMLRDNELVINQGLNDLEKSVIPGWRDMLALGWAAYRAKGAVEFINTLRSTDAEIRLAKARMIGDAAVQIAALKKTPTFDIESMKVLNDKLIEALNVLKAASEEGAKIRTAAEQTNDDLVLQLSKVVADQAIK